MNKKIMISDKTKITESIKITTSLNLPTIYYKEFFIYRNKYLESNLDSDLVMSYILLQLFLENHFSYYLRFLIGGGLRKEIKGYKEKLNIYNKYDDKGVIKEKGKISIFFDYLTENSFVVNSNDFLKILTLYAEISKIRNLFIHGHPVTETNNNGSTSISESKDFLNRPKFGYICDKSNQICECWNRIMCDLQNQSVLLSKYLCEKSFLDNCKFKLF
jgi:hypothetical protein